MTRNNNVEVIVYGTEQICSSCANLPSSKDTFEWLQAAISRKYPDQPIKITYVDILNPPQEPAISEFAKRIIEENMFYPIVTINGKIAGEGNPRLKTIYTELQKHGFE